MHDPLLPTSHDPAYEGSGGWSRREILAALAGAGIGTSVFRRALAAQVAAGRVTAEMIQQAEWIAGISLTDEQREAAAGALQRLRGQWERLRAIPLDPNTPPALYFFPASPASSDTEVRRLLEVEPRASMVPPATHDDLAFATVADLARWLRAGHVSSVELTQLALERLKKFDPLLKCVVTLTEETALEQARRADQERAAGKARGALHGIPWGAKDLVSYPGYRTTWGAQPFADQQFDIKATVARRLDDAGAVLVAKLSMGALAQGDQWFGGMTRNPWNPEQGSSGSSAGSGAATAAGLVPFAIGTETLGSIVSPCRRCGVSGLRPTFGRVSRYGCMALAWSMDKIGPIARSVEDCALVFAAIHGSDGRDFTAVDRPFTWPLDVNARRPRIGYFEHDNDPATRNVVDFLRDQGMEMRPIELPKNVPASALVFILNTEAATAFDDLTRRGITEGLNRWPSAFHQGELTPAVEYLRANRIRQQLVRDMERLFEDVDAYVGGDDLAITNLTGHPTVVFPAAVAESGGVRQPVCATMTGRLYGEDLILALAHSFQQQTDFHHRRPDLEGPLRALRSEGPSPPK